jgi:hypothetical protein
MADAGRVERRRDALLAWRRRAHEERGISDGDLPTEADLVKIASSAAMTETEVAAVPTAQRGKILKFAREVAGGLADATRMPMPVEDRTEPMTRVDAPAPDPVSPEDKDWPPFARYSPSAGWATTRGTIRAVTDPGGLRYRWQPLSDNHVIYRVVSDDVARPYDPDFAEVVETTYLTEVTDSRPIAAARRYVQVWAHVGLDAESAAAAQPRLVAETTVVAPVRNCRLGVSGNQVSGSWDPVDGIERILVTRVPTAMAQHLGEDYDRKDLVREEQETSSGFVDDNCPPGRWEYRVYAGVRLDGLVLSPPRKFPVVVDDVLKPVTDLRVTSLGDGREVRLDWATGSGRPGIYLTPQQPPLGLDEKPVESSRLPSAGLSPDALLHQPSEPGAAGRTIPRVPLPDVDGIVYFTPVTFVGLSAYVGRTVAYTLPNGITSARLVERVNIQLVTFNWPVGADTVELHETRKGYPLAEPPGVPLESLDYDGYLARGGMRITTGRLPPQGCDLHLVPVIWHGAVKQRGSATTLRYEGLMLVEYRLAGGGSRRMVPRSRGRRVLEVRVDTKVTLPFVVVHNSDRLPLSPQDGSDGSREVLRTKATLEAGVWTQLGEFRVPGSSGWLRVFVDLDRSVIAVLDPPVRTLVV